MKQPLQRIAIGLSHAIAPLFSLEKWLSITGKNLILPFYHTISDKALPHIKHVYPTVHTQRFSEDMDTLLKTFDPIDTSQLVDLIKNGKTLERPSFYLSFDDGLSEVYRQVHPILKEKGIPAAVFINDDFLDNKDLFYRYKVSLIIEHIKTHDISGEGQSAIQVLLKGENILSRSIATGLKSVKYHQEEVLGRIADVLHIDFAEFLAKEQPYMTKSQVLELQDDGFTIGAHTSRHPLLQDLMVDEQIKLCQESVDGIAELFKSKHRIFAFPFTDHGIAKNFFDRAYRPGQELMEVSFGSSGLNIEYEPRHLQRFPMEGIKGSAQWALEGAFSYFWLKRIIGKHKTLRK